MVWSGRKQIYEEKNIFCILVTKSDILKIKFLVFRYLFYYRVFTFKCVYTTKESTRFKNIIKLNKKYFIIYIYSN